MTDIREEVERALGDDPTAPVYFKLGEFGDPRDEAIAGWLRSLLTALREAETLRAPSDRLCLNNHAAIRFADSEGQNRCPLCDERRTTEAVQSQLREAELRVTRLTERWERLRNLLPTEWRPDFTYLDVWRVMSALEAPDTQPSAPATSPDTRETPR